MVYVGGRFETRREDVLERKFTCAHCGLACRVEILARGEGTGRSPYFLDNAGAVRSARDAAVYASAADADRVVALARCPRCQRRNRAAWARFVCWNVFKLAALGGLVALPVALGKLGTAAVVLFTSGTVVALYVLTVHKIWWRIERRMWVPRDPEDRRR